MRWSSMWGGGLAELEPQVKRPGLDRLTGEHRKASKRWQIVAKPGENQAKGIEIAGANGSVGGSTDLARSWPSTGLALR